MEIPRFFGPQIRPSFSFEYIQELFSQVAPGYDVMNGLMSFFLDHKWRQQGAQYIPWMSFYQNNRGHFALGDAASGTGDMFGALLPFLLTLYKDYGSLENFFSIFLMDPNENMLHHGRQKIIQWFSNENFSMGDLFQKTPKNLHEFFALLGKFLHIHRQPPLGHLHGHQRKNILGAIHYYPWALETMDIQGNSLDLLTLSFGLRNVEPSKRPLGISKVFHSLKPGGWFFLMDFLPPQSTPFPLIYRQYLKILPILGHWVLENSQAYAYLVHSIENFLSPGEICSLLENAGFHNIQSTSLFPHVLQVYRCEKKN